MRLSGRALIQQMIELIPEDDWKDAVQIIGWLYPVSYTHLDVYKRQVLHWAKAQLPSRSTLPGNVTEASDERCV